MAMGRPTVSVIIPTHNYGRFIEEALESVLAQTYRDLEVVVVDDGSTDDTRERVRALGPRVTYLYQPGAGAAAARNRGIQHSRGAYVAFLDEDDVWLPRRVERTVAALEGDPEAGVAYTWQALTDEAGRPLPQAWMPAHEGEVLDVLLLGCFLLPSMVTVRRACLDRVGRFDAGLRLVEDWDLFLRLALAGYRFRCVPEILVRYRLHAAAVSADVVGLLRSGRAVLDRALGAPGLPARLRDGAFRTAAYRVFCLNGGAHCIRRGRWEEGRLLLIEGVRHEPAVLARPGLYVGLALRVLPFGYQTWPELTARLSVAAALLAEILRAVLGARELPRPAHRRAWSALHLALAVLYARSGRRARAALHLGRSLAIHPPTVLAAAARGLRGHWGAVETTLGIPRAPLGGTR